MSMRLSGHAVPPSLASTFPEESQSFLMETPRLSLVDQTNWRQGEKK